MKRLVRFAPQLTGTLTIRVPSIGDVTYTATQDGNNLVLETSSQPRAKFVMPAEKVLELSGAYLRHYADGPGEEVKLEIRNDDVRRSYWGFALNTHRGNPRFLLDNGRVAEHWTHYEEELLPLMMLLNNISAGILAK